MPDTLNIKYIGAKPFKRDTIANTGLTWRSGQVHAVPAYKGSILKSFPDVWAVTGEPVQEGEDSPSKTNSAKPPPSISERDALIQRAGELGIQVIKNWTNATLLNKIKEAELVNAISG